MEKYTGPIGLQQLMQLIKEKFTSLANVARSGSYNDLSDKPSIPDASSSISVTLSASGWSGSGPYTYTLTASGVTTSSNGQIGLSPSATDAQYGAAALANIRITAQSANSITLTATGTKPMVDLPVVLVLV